MNGVVYYKGSLGDRPDSVFPPCMLHDALVFCDYFKNSFSFRYTTEDRRSKTEDRRTRWRRRLNNISVIIFYNILPELVTILYLSKFHENFFFLATWLYFKFHLKYSSNLS